MWLEGDDGRLEPIIAEIAVQVLVAHGLKKKKISVPGAKIKRRNVLSKALLITLKKEAKQRLFEKPHLGGVLKYNNLIKQLF